LSSLPNVAEQITAIWEANNKQNVLLGLKVLV